MGVSKNRGTPKWMENPIRMDDLGVPIFLETPNIEDFLLLFLGPFLSSFSGCDFFFWKGGRNWNGFIPKNMAIIKTGVTFSEAHHFGYPSIGFCWGLGIHTKWAPTIVINGLSFHYLLSFIARWKWILDLFSHPCKGDSIWTHVSKKHVPRCNRGKPRLSFYPAKNKTQEGAPLVIR